MRVLRTGEFSMGKDYARMINDAIGTNFTGYQRCTVDMTRFGVEHVISWFVFMDGTVHGYTDGLIWKNKISDDGKTIREFNVNTDKSGLIKRRLEDGYHPYRLCFRLDPNEVNKHNQCKFIGAFRFSKFLSEDLSGIEYVKVLDEFKIGSIGDGYNPALNSKQDFLHGDVFCSTPVEKVGFSGLTYLFLKKHHVNTVGDLLELGISAKGEISEELRPIIDEINKTLYNIFHLHKANIKQF